MLQSVCHILDMASLVPSMLMMSLLSSSHRLIDDQCQQLSLSLSSASSMLAVQLLRSHDIDTVVRRQQRTHSHTLIHHKSTYAHTHTRPHTHHIVSRR